jgi:hypothetical protein
MSVTRSLRNLFGVGGASAAKEDAPSGTTWEALAEELTGGKPDTELDAALEEFRSAQSGNPGEFAAADAKLRRIVIGRMHAARRSALCMSGGGIRSAIFGLGVLQGLAIHSCDTEPEAPAPMPTKLLAEVDFLSTVSGGGYAGSWFSTWAARCPEGPGGVIKELASPPESDWDPEPAPLRWLRTYANYLNPQLGVLSADTWTLLATVGRNLTLNWIVLLPLMASVLALPRIFYKLVANIPNGNFHWNWMLYASAALLAFSIAYMVIDLPTAGNARLPQKVFLVSGLGPLVISSVGFVLFWAWAGFLEDEPKASGFVQYGIVIMATGVFSGTLGACIRQRHFKSIWLLRGLGFALAAGALGGLFACWMTWAFTNPADDSLYSVRVYAWLSIPCLFAVFALAQGVLVGLASRITGDEDREWFSRAAAWILITMICAAVFTGLALMPPVLVKWLPPLNVQAAITALTGAIVGKLGNSSSVKAGESEQAAAESSSSLTTKLVALAPKLVMPVFLLALLSLIATFNETMSNYLNTWLMYPPLWSPFPHLEAHPALTEAMLAAGLAIPALIASFWIDANKFSLHAMYRNRLIRTFLGASNPGRKENPFTGFDPADNLLLTQLPAKPLHVFNMTLNLVKGGNLAWQQRKGETFTATRYRVGSGRVGYRPSGAYASGISVGSAVAISGAAANPNMGYASSPLLSIIMMLFNARLGAWLPNPGKAGDRTWRQHGPTSSLLPFVDEAFGLTTDHHPWVNLSDGGHFENLGIYEMALRRCATIIVVDGGCDPSYHFDDLGNAIRKIFVDMGIPIDFPDGVPIMKSPCDASRHIAVGRLRYSAVDGAGTPDGTIIYLKSSLTDNEPQDVRNYASQYPSFPHQTTADQWFDEAQFESYRRLGVHVVEEIFRFKNETATLDEFVALARSYAAKLARAEAAAGVV